MLVKQKYECLHGQTETNINKCNKMHVRRTCVFSEQEVLVSAVYIFRFHNGVYLAIYTCLFRWCYGHFYNRLTQFIVYCSYIVCTILLRRPVDLSTHWTVTAITITITITNYLFRQNRTRNITKVILR